LPISLNTSADSITEFSNPSTPNERIITLAGEEPPYMDATTYFEIPRNRGLIQSASMTVTSVDGSEQFPVNPYIDVGLDGEPDWMFDGPGYGPLGYQTEFESGKDRDKLFMIGQNYNSDLGIQLPKDAVVTKAVMNVTSRYCKGSILIVQDNADAIGIGKVDTALKNLGYSTYIATSESNLPVSWDDPDLYPAIFWFVDETGTSYNGVGNAYTGKMVEYVKNGGCVLTTGPNIDYTGAYSGVDEVPFYTWVLHHYWGNQWTGGGSGKWNYANTQITNTSHPIFSYPNDIIPYSPWQSSLYEILWYNPSGIYANGQSLADNLNVNREIIVAWDGYEYGDYGRTVCIRSAITQGWHNTNKGDVLSPLVQNIAYWTAGFPTALEDCALDVGDLGGAKDWSYTGKFQGTETTADFSQKLNLYLTSAPYFEDGYGNKFVSVPLNFTSKTYGGLILDELKIEYELTSTVDKKPENKNLAMVLNDLIPTPENTGQTQDLFPVYIAVYSDTPCKLKLSDLNIIYNGAPKCNGIPSTYSVSEDSYNEYLINLTNYFKDDIQASEYLEYEIESSTNPEYVDILIFDRYFLGVNAERDPHTNWHGTTDVVVSASDSQGVKAYSNEFSITVAEVDDSPEIGHMIPNLNITKYGSNRMIDLDDVFLLANGSYSRYFRDVDSDILYFKAIVSPNEELNLDAGIDDGNVLNITAIGDYRLHIPVKIFCDDDSWTITKLNDFNSETVLYQQIIVNITTSGGKTPPVWKELPDAVILEDTIVKNWRNLRDYVTDMDDSIENITFSIVTISNSAYLNLYIGPTGIVDIIPNPDFDGIAKVTLKAEDDEHCFALANFTIIMMPVNDIPNVQIFKPVPNSVVSGSVTIEGLATDAENNVEYVELKFGNESADWFKVNGTTYWDYVWDTLVYAPGTSAKVTVLARAFDGEDHSEVIYINVHVDNHNIDADGDGYPNSVDIFPNDPSEWVDTDLDGVGDNKDMFPKNASEWVDTDGDNYGDNSDAFPLLFSEWLDTDGDGVGDNADVYPEDPDRHSLLDPQDGSGAEDPDVTEVFLWSILAIIIILNVLIFIYYVKIHKREKNLRDKKL
jgi:hypothetical protein